MITLTVLVKVLEGRGDEYVRHLQKLVPLVRKDPGVITYSLQRNSKDPDQFLFYEKFENEDFFKYHGSTKHAKEFSNSTNNMLAAPPEVNYYDEIV
jgi:quinol monooxygenase YgiN